jgi:SH3 domain protein
MRLKILIITLFITAPLLANAKIYIYVTDQVSIPMRSENKIQSRPNNVLKMLPSGAELEILSTKNGWTQIKYKNQTGWIMSRYLTARPPAIVQLEELKKIYNDSNSLSEMKVDIKISNKVIEKNIKKTLDFLEEQKNKRVVSAKKNKISKVKAERITKEKAIVVAKVEDEFSEAFDTLVESLEQLPDNVIDKVNLAQKVKVLVEIKSNHYSQELQLAYINSLSKLIQQKVNTGGAKINVDDIIKRHSKEFITGPCLAEESKKGTKITPFNPSHLAKIKALNECEYCNLNGADLSNMVFDSTKFKGSSLICANFNNSKLYYIYFDETNLTGASFQNIKSKDNFLPRIKFKNANLENTDFTNADMRDSDFKGANLSNANLETAILTNAEMTEATLCNTKTPWGIDNRDCKRLAKEKLEAERKAKAKTEEAKLEAERKAKAKAEEKAKVKVKAAEPQNRPLNSTHLLKLKALKKCNACDLNTADLSNMNLVSYNFKKASLVNANFTNSRILGADFSGADLTGANFSNVVAGKADSGSGWVYFDANFSDTILTDANFSNADLTEVRFRGAQLSNANFSTSILDEAEFEGAIFCNTKTPWGLDNSGCKKE